MRETMAAVTDRAWLCDPRSVTDEERPWLELPEEELVPAVILAVEAAGQSSVQADGLALYLWRKKRGLATGRSHQTRATYRRILAEIGPPPKARRRRHAKVLNEAGYASLRAIGAAGAASSAAMAATGHPAGLLALPLYVTMTGSEPVEEGFDQELLAA